MRYLVVDLEATCCDDDSIAASEQETIEIGAAMLDRAVVATFQTFVRPQRHPLLTRFCMELTGIKQQDVDSAAPLPAAFTSFLEWALQFGAWHFASWGTFDEQQLLRDCAFHDIAYPMGRHIDLAHVFRKHAGCTAGRERAMRLLGVKPEGTRHRGIDDARNAAGIAAEMQSRGWMT